MPGPPAAQYIPRVRAGAWGQKCAERDNRPPVSTWPGWPAAGHARRCAGGLSGAGAGVACAAVAESERWPAAWRASPDS